MLFAQADLASNWNQGVAVAVLMFVSYWISYWMLRTYGKNGTDTKEVASRIENNKRNSLTMAASQVTLVELKELAASQQRHCGRHALSMTTVEAELDSVDEKLDVVVESSKSVADEWGDLNHKEFRTPPILDALMHMVETAEVLADKEGRDCKTELRELRTNLESIKARMKAK